MIVRAIHKTSDIIDKYCCYLLVAILIAMVVTTTLQIVCRIFFNALDWSEEVTRYLLVWSTFIGAGCVYKRSGHIDVLIVQNRMPGLLRKVMKLTVLAICMIVFLIAVVYGFRYMGMQGSQLSAALRVPMKYMYMVIPVGCLIMMIHAISHTIDIFTRKEEEEV